VLVLKGVGGYYGLRERSTFAGFHGLGVMPGSPKRRKCPPCPAPGFPPRGPFQQPRTPTPWGPPRGPIGGYYGLAPRTTIGVGGIWDWIRRQLPEEVRNIQPGRVLEDEVRRRLRESEIRRIIEQARQGGASDAELQRLLASLGGTARTNWPVLAAGGIAAVLLLRGRRRR